MKYTFLYLCSLLFLNSAIQSCDSNNTTHDRTTLASGGAIEEDWTTVSKKLIVTFHGRGGNGYQLKKFVEEAFPHKDNGWTMEHLQAKDYFEDGLWIPEVLNNWLIGLKLHKVRSSEEDFRTQIQQALTEDPIISQAYYGDMITRMNMIKGRVLELANFHNVGLENIIFIGYSLGGMASSHVSQIMDKSIMAAISVNSVADPFILCADIPTSSYPKYAIFMANRWDGVMPYKIVDMSRKAFLQKNSASKVINRDIDDKECGHRLCRDYPGLVKVTVERLLGGATP